MFAILPLSANTVNMYVRLALLLMRLVFALVNILGHLVLYSVVMYIPAVVEEVVMKMESVHVSQVMRFLYKNVCTLLKFRECIVIRISRNLPQKLKL